MIFFQNIKEFNTSIKVVTQVYVYYGFHLQYSLLMLIMKS